MFETKKNKKKKEIKLLKLFYIGISSISGIGVKSKMIHGTVQAKKLKKKSSNTKREMSKEKASAFEKMKSLLSLSKE